jgi:hypothetical protein
MGTRNLRRSAAACGIIGCVTVPPAVAFWETPIWNTSTFGGRIAATEAVDFTAVERDQKVSPLCGCYAELERDKWAGISFIAPSLSASYAVQDDTVFAISVAAPLPSSINYDRVIMYKVRFIKSNDPNFALSNSFYEIADLTILTKSEINIRGNVAAPQYSFLPASFSKNSLKFENEKSSLAIESIETETQERDAHSFPMLDVIGPSILISFDPDEALVGTGVNDDQVSKFPDNFSFEGVDAIEIMVPFSARFVFSSIKQPYRNLAAIQKDSSMLVDGSRPGKIKLKTSTPLDVEWYKSAQEVLDRKNVVVREQVWNARLEADGKEAIALAGPGSMNYRMPTIAPRLGFDIYGPAKLLTVEGATGDLMIGSRALPISAPSNLTFREVSPVKQEDGWLSKPLTIDRDSGGSVKFQAVSSIEINEQPVVSGGLTIGNTLGVIGGFLSLVVSALGLIPATDENGPNDRRGNWIPFRERAKRKARTRPLR